MIWKITFQNPRDRSPKVAWIYGCEHDKAAGIAFRRQYPEATQIVVTSMMGEVIDGTDYYVIVEHSSGRRYSLNRSYRLNSNPGFHISVDGFVEKDFITVGWDVPEDWPTDGQSVAYWMY